MYHLYGVSSSILLSSILYQDHKHRFLYIFFCTELKLPFCFF